MQQAFGTATHKKYYDAYMRPKMPDAERTQIYREVLAELDPKDSASKQILFSMVFHVSRDDQTLADLGVKDSFDFMMHYLKKVRPEIMSDEDAQKIKNSLTRRLNENPGYMYDGFALDMPEIWEDSTPADYAAAGKPAP